MEFLFLSKGYCLNISANLGFSTGDSFTYGLLKEKADVSMFPIQPLGRHQEQILFLVHIVRVNLTLWISYFRSMWRVT